jgi:hypothetical protein
MKCDEGDGYNNVCSVLGLTSYYYWELDRHWKLKRLKAENDIDFLGTQDSTFPLGIYLRHFDIYITELPSSADL